MKDMKNFGFRTQFRKAFI